MSQDRFYQIFRSIFYLEVTFGDEAENGNIGSINCGVGSLCLQECPMNVGRGDGCSTVHEQHWDEQL